MSIQSEITRISGNVADALSAISSKGVSVPSGANSDDLHDLIMQISGGGGDEYIAMVTGPGSTTSSSYYYLQYNNTKYYPPGTDEYLSFTFTPGDIASIYFPQGYTPSMNINMDGVTVLSSGTRGPYELTLLKNNTLINFQGSRNTRIDTYDITQQMITHRFRSPYYEDSYIKQIGPYAFASCSAITEVSFPEVSIIYSSGFYSAGLTYAYFPKCEEIYPNAFMYCDDLSYVSFPSCTKLSEKAFASCYSLASVSFPLLKTVSPTAFYECRTLQEINLPECTAVGDMAFQACSNLVSVSLPKCTSLSGTLNYSYMSGAFARCSNLSNLYIPSVTKVEACVFCSCAALSSFSFSSGVSFSSGGYQFVNCGFTELDSSEITGITDYMFSGCLSLSRVLFSNYSGQIGAYAFRGCTSLNYVSIPKCTYVKTYAFNGDKLLTSVNVSSASVISAYGFGGCTALTSAYFPNVNTVGNYGFNGCQNLSALYLSHTISEQGLFSQSAFATCYNLLSLYLLGSTIYKLSNKNAFGNTPISTYTTSTGGVRGSIFVPSDLLATYKAATNWTTYSARFVGLTASEIAALPIFSSTP